MSGNIKSQDGMAIEKRLYTTKEVAKYLRCSERTVYNRVKEGKIKPIYNGRLVLFTMESIEDYLKLCSQQS
jgi:excisionase family DNA binding protein